MLTNARLNTTPFFIMKILVGQDLQWIAINHSSSFDFEVFVKTYRKYNVKLYLFLAIDTTLGSDNTFCLWKNLMEEV